MKTKISLSRIALSFIMGGLLMVSCGEKITEEDEVKNFTKDFLVKAQAHSYDSIIPFYEEIIMADSIVPVNPDNLKVQKISDGNYIVTSGEGVIMKISKAEDGAFTVTESKGLFSFPSIQSDIARKTGLWNDTLNDARLAERMDDHAYFSYIAIRAKSQTSNPVSVEKSKVSKTGYTLTNNTDVPIRATEYEIVKRYGNPDREEEISNETFPGQDIPPHESIEVESTKPKGVTMEVVNVRFNLSDDEYNKKFASYNGNEYQEYLDSKSLLTDKPDSIPHIKRERQLMPQDTKNKAKTNVKKKK